MKNLVLRSLTGIVFVAVLVGCIVAGGIWFNGLFVIIMAFALDEFYRLTNKYGGAQVNRSLAVPAGVYLFGVMSILADKASGASTMALLAPYFGLLVLILVCELYRKSPDPLRNWAYAFAGQVYAALPFCLLPLLAYRTDFTGIFYDYTIPLSIFLFLWTSDTGAYCCGSLLHKYIPAKLFPRISPNKSWVGSVGGGVLCLVVAYVLWQSFGCWNVWIWMGFGLVVCIMGTLGDLVESLLKRQLGIKDSGNLLPGHGGSLDRFDSALLAIPSVLCYFSLLDVI